MTFLRGLLWVLIAIPGLFILLVLAAWASGAYSLRRSIRIASASPCPECGKTIGRASVLAGKDRFSDKIRDMWKQHPGIKFRIIAEWEIECPHCGRRFFFYPDTIRIERASIFSHGSSLPDCQPPGQS